MQPLQNDFALPLSNHPSTVSVDRTEDRKDRRHTVPLHSRRVSLSHPRGRYELYRHCRVGISLPCASLSPVHYEECCIRARLRPTCPTHTRARAATLSDSRDCIVVSTIGSELRP